MDPALVKGVGNAPFPNTYSSAVLDVIKVIENHIPSITREIEEAYDWPLDLDGEYIGDQRECRCGQHIDGFYSYVDHLLGLLGKESHFGG